ncbi:MAG: hypothetical protein ACTSQJ_17010, partial [Promethearchaeota archaeon]
KLLLIILLTVVLIIQPISKPFFIIDWELISGLNILRAVIVIIALAFLPGALLYNIFFSSFKIKERFKVEPFIFKLTIYPLISFIFIGINVFFMDQLRVSKELIPFILYFLILILFFVDITFQKIKKVQIRFEKIKISINRTTFIIILTALGVLFISIGIHFGTKYLFPGDSWDGLSSAMYIGDNEYSPIDYGREKGYPIFWGYIIYGLSSLSGIPLVNTCVLLTPFTYIFVFSMYILFRMVLFDMKEIYVIFSTILALISAGLFYVSINLGAISSLIFWGYFTFVYKGFSYYLMFLAVALIIFVIKEIDIEESNKNKRLQTDDYKILILSSFFLIIAYIVYMIPLLIGFILIVLFILFSKEKLFNLSVLIRFFFLTIVFFIFFDVVMNFQLSYIFYRRVAIFFEDIISIFLPDLGILKNIIFTYIVLGGAFILIILIQKIYSKLYLEKERELKIKIKISDKKIFLIITIIFFIFLIMEIFLLILEEFFIKYDLADKYAYKYILDKFFLNFGVILILGLLLMKFTYEKNRRLFAFLISWIIVISFMASILMLKTFFLNHPNASPEDIPKIELFFLRYWYILVYFYVIPALCILTAIGLIEISRFLNSKVNIQKDNVKIIVKNASILILIFLLFSNALIAGIYWGSGKKRFKNYEVQIIGWSIDNIPENSKILVDDYITLKTHLRDINKWEIYSIDDVFDENNNESQNLEQIKYIREKNIQYAILYKHPYYINEDLFNFLENFLIPNYYNETLYEYGELAVYYASFD